MKLSQANIVNGRGVGMLLPSRLRLRLAPSLGRSARRIRVKAAAELADETVVLPKLAELEKEAPAAKNDSWREGGFIESAEAGVEEEEVVKVEATLQDESLLVENNGLSETACNALKGRGITALFPIQQAVLKPALEGRDVIGRARTGSGKTLAFALPIVERLTAKYAEQRPAKGRAPSALVLAPTRELAKQVEKEITTIAPDLFTLTVYGGTSRGPQIRDLRRGVDIVVGTPGRVMDLMADVLVLDKATYVVLDEADEMLDMGFQHDVEKILEECAPERQTLLFSATLPGWVRKVSRKYQNSAITVDLVGEQETGRMADSITPLAVLCQEEVKDKMLVDLLYVYGQSGKAIVFTQTKRSADEVSVHLSRNIACEALHGDIDQDAREETMDRFRSGKIDLLVATDVAARGLDIPNVDLVVHYELPQQAESFLHRSGRTGRAGRSGTTIALVGPNDLRAFQNVLKVTKTPINFIPPPDPSAVVKAATQKALHSLARADDTIAKQFVEPAKQLLETVPPVQALATALAVVSGFRDIPAQRSALGQTEGSRTLKIVAHQRAEPIMFKGRVLRTVRVLAGDDVADAVEKIAVDQDGQTRNKEAYFDLDSENCEQLMAAIKKPSTRLARIVSSEYTISYADTVPSWAFISSGRNRSSGNRRWGGQRSGSYSSRGGRNDFRSSGGDFRRGNDGYRRGGSQSDYRRGNDSYRSGGGGASRGSRPWEGRGSRNSGSTRRGY